MKQIITPLLVSFGLIYALPTIAQEASSAAMKATDPWPVERIQAWQKQEGWRVGANFLPSTAINQHEMWSAATWDPVTLKRELDLVRDTGMNTLRVYLHDRSYGEDSDGFLKRMDLFLGMCSERGIKPMLVFFDDCWLDPSQTPTLIPVPRPGTHNSGWLQSPGSSLVRAYSTDKALQARLKGYVQSVLRHFAKDQRILAWDLFNEPGNRANKRFDDKGQELLGDHKSPPEIKGDCALLHDVFAWAREVNPQQPLTSGVWTGLTPAPSPIVRLQLENSDFISFHNYGNLGNVKSMVADLRKQAAGRPLLCSEYMARNTGCTIESILPYFAAENISAINWGFVDGKSQTKYSWGSWNQPEPDEPKLWFHDLYRKDGTPYHQAEVDVIRKVIAGKKATAISAPDAVRNDASLDAWRELKYGMFIHFGMATFTGRANENDPKNATEPSMLYAPTHLDVDQWIRVAREAGMKYAVLTAKHTAGHCLWDSKVRFRGKEFDYDVATSGNKTDVVAEFVKACGKHGLMPGLYWCPLDFRNNSVPAGPQWNKGELPDDFFQFTQDQLTELIKTYPDVGYYWLDIPRAVSAGQRRVIYDMIKRLRPGTVVLFNHGTVPPTGPLTIDKCQVAWPTDVLNTERHPCKPGQFNPEQTWQGRNYQLGYEHCDCLCKSWFWLDGDMPRPTRELFKIHSDVVAAGGNLLLDVAPDRSGRIPAYSVKALMELKRMIDDPPVFKASLNLNAKASASNIYRNERAYGPDAAVDGDITTRWATDDGTKSAWLDVDLGKQASVGRVVVEQAFPELKRVRKFAIEYRVGDEWKACYRGENLGATLDTRFDPVTARHFRLNITECTDGPTIWEFQLFAK